MGSFPMSTNVNENDLEAGIDPTVVTPTQGGLERELFGPWSVALRNIGGIFAVLVVCIMGVFNSYTIFVSVTTNHIWPSETSMFIMVVGPVICSWTFMNSSKTISTIMQIKGVSGKVRNRMAAVLATEDVKVTPNKPAE